MAAPGSPLSPAAEPSLGPLFEDVRQTFQISWTPRVFVALGQIRGFLPLAWAGLKPSAATEQFARLAERIRDDTAGLARSLYQPGYGPGDLQSQLEQFDDLAALRTALDALTFGQTQTLLAVEALRLAIDGFPTGGSHPISWPRVQTTWALQPIPTVQASTVGEDVRRVFEEARAFTGLAWPPRSLEALANWPDHLRLAWSDLGNQLRTPDVAAARGALIERAATYCQLLPTKVEVTPGYLERSGEAPLEINRARELLVEWEGALPANLLLTAFLRLPLGGLRVSSLGR